MCCPSFIIISDCWLVAPIHICATVRVLPERRVLLWCEQHDIRVMGVEIHRGIEVCTQTSFKRVAHRLMPAHPFAQLDYWRFVGCEVYETMSGKHREYIQVICKSPGLAVCSGFGEQIWRIDEKYNSRRIFIVLEELHIVTWDNLKTGKIVGAYRIVCLAYSIVKSLFAERLKWGTVFHWKQQWCWYGDIIYIAVVAFFPGYYIDNSVASNARNQFLRGNSDAMGRMDCSSALVRGILAIRRR